MRKHVASHLVSHSPVLLVVPSFQPLSSRPSVLYSLNRRVCKRKRWIIIFKNVPASHQTQMRRRLVNHLFCIEWQNAIAFFLSFFVRRHFFVRTLACAICPPQKTTTQRRENEVQCRGLSSEGNSFSFNKIYSVFIYNHFISYLHIRWTNVSNSMSCERILGEAPFVPIYHINQHNYIVNILT